MAVPKRKTTPSKRNMRRGHDSLKPINVVENATTGEQTLPHHVSLDGYYNGRQVFVSASSGNDGDLEETL